MRLITNFLLISTLLVVTGCATAPRTELPDPVVVTKYVRAECGSPPARSAVNLRPVVWRVVGGQFTLSPEGYEDLSYNVTAILAGIKELNSEIGFYEQCLLSTPQKPEDKESSSE